MAIASSPAEEIQREMRQIRVELKENVQEIVSNAKEIVDWQSYVRSHPWLMMGAAALVGYLLVPNRTTVIRPDPEAMRELSKSRQLLENQVKPRSLMGMVAGMVAASAGQAALAIASHHAQKLLQSTLEPVSPRPGDYRHD